MESGRKSENEFCQLSDPQLDVSSYWIRCIYS